MTCGSKHETALGTTRKFVIANHPPLQTALHHLAEPFPSYSSALGFCTSSCALSVMCRKPAVRSPTRTSTNNKDMYTCVVRVGCISQGRRCFAFPSPFAHSYSPQTHSEVICSEIVLSPSISCLMQGVQSCQPLCWSPEEKSLEFHMRCKFLRVSYLRLNVSETAFPSTPR